MKIETKSKSTSATYTVDLKNVTCTCPDFKYRRSRYSKKDPERLCKHLKEEMRKLTVPGSGDRSYQIDLIEVTCTCPDFKMRRSHYGKYDSNRLCKHLRKCEQDGLIEVLKDKKNASEGRMKRELVANFATMIDTYLSDNPHVIKFKICGSWRRGVEYLKDLDVVLVVSDVTEFRSHLDAWATTQFHTFRWSGDKKIAIRLFNQFAVDFLICEEVSWPFACLHFTGPKTSNINLRQKASIKGTSLSEYGFKIDGEYSSEGCKTEEDIFEFLGVDYIKPKDRV